MNNQQTYAAQAAAKGLVAIPLAKYSAVAKSHKEVGIRRVGRLTYFSLDLSIAFLRLESIS